MGCAHPSKTASRTRSRSREVTLPLCVKARALPPARPASIAPAKCGMEMGWRGGGRSFLCALATEGNLQLAKWHRPLSLVLRKKKSFCCQIGFTGRKHTNTLRRTREREECETPSQPAAFARPCHSFLDATSQVPGSQTACGNREEEILFFVQEALLNPLTKNAILLSALLKWGLREA